ncbi:MAG: PadR family transcriptional regulator, partial [Faecalibacterium prausnitzii]
KKAIQLEEKGLIRGEIVKEGKMPEKVIYSLTDAGEAEFERLMFEISEKPINIFLDFNAVIVNLDSLPPEKQKSCIAEIEENISTLKSYLEYNIQKKENEPSIPATGMAVLRQQYVLVEAIQAWIALLKENQINPLE